MKTHHILMIVTGLALMLTSVPARSQGVPDANACMMLPVPPDACLDRLIQAAQAQLERGSNEPVSIQAAYALGERYASKALEIATGAAADTDRAAMAHNFVALFTQRTAPAQAEASYGQAIAISAGRPGGALAIYLRNYGMMLVVQGRHGEAEALFRRALTVAEQTADTDSIRRSLESLGSVLTSQGRNAEADLILRRVLVLNMELFGADSAEAAWNYRAIGLNLSEQSRYDEARVFYRRALDIRLKLFGERDARTATSYYDLGNMALAEGDWDDSAAYFAKAYELRRALFGEGAATTLAAAFQAAQVEWHRGDSKAAVAGMRRALAAQIAELGEDSLSVAGSQKLLAMFLHSEGAHAEEEALYARAVATYRRRMSAMDSSLIAAVSEMGITYRAHGKLAEALAYHRTSSKLLLRRLADSSRDPDLAHERARKHTYFRDLVETAWLAAQ